MSLFTSSPDPTLIVPVVALLFVLKPNSSNPSLSIVGTFIVHVVLTNVSHPIDI